MTRLRFKAPAGLLDSLGPMIAGLAKQLFTAADGETYAIGRFLAIILMVWGLAAPTGVAVWLIVDKKPDLGEWVRFIDSMVLYLPALVAGVVGLITLTIPAERTEGDRRERERIQRGPQADAGTDDGSAPPLP